MTPGRRRGDETTPAAMDLAVGQRVSLRYRDEVDGHPVLRDVVGEIVAVDGASHHAHAHDDADETGVVVDGRRGRVRVQRSAVVAARVVLAAAPRRAPLAAVVRLEGLCADAWPALVDRPLGRWRLRAANGFTGRANSALAIGDPGRSIQAALEAVHEFAREHGIAPRVQVPVGSPWHRAIAAHGWVEDVGHPAGFESAVLVRSLDQAPVGRPEGAHVVTLADHPTPQWWSIGPDRGAATDTRSAAALAVIDPPGPPTTVFALASAIAPPHPPLGRLRGALADDHVHLAELAVAETARRHGCATALVDAVLRWGREHAARAAVLQVTARNDAARTFYEALGFVEHHRYRYLVPSGQD